MPDETAREGLQPRSSALFFTDVESSVLRWEREPEAMAVDLARHVAILTDVAERHDGDVVKWTGDGMLATFPAAARALDAAVAAQRMFRSATWVASTPLRVRIAVHVGSPRLAWGDLHGRCVNRCARMVQATSGGHIVISREARDIAGRVPRGARLTDLGEHRLPDVLEPLHLFEVVHPDAVPSPPLRTGNAA